MKKPELRLQLQLSCAGIVNGARKNAKGDVLSEKEYTESEDEVQGFKEMERISRQDET